MLSKIIKIIAFKTGRLKSLYLKICKPSAAEYSEYIRKWGNLYHMGKDVVIWPYTNITDPEYTSLGDNVMLTKCTVLGHDGSIAVLNKAFNKKLDSVGKVDIRNNVFVGHGAIILPGVSLGELIRTPWQGEGPFYPDRIPEDTDNDLVKNGHSTIEAGGKILNLMGSLVNRDSKPIKGMTAEIWQTDMNGVYLHTGSFRSKMRDDQFQGFGRSITDRNGHFFFRTIIPVEYPGRTPHIHLKLWNERENVLTTQLYIQGHSLNKEDFLFKRMTIAEQKINSMKLLPTQTNDSTEYVTSVRLVVFS